MGDNIWGVKFIKRIYMVKRLYVIMIVEKIVMEWMAFEVDFN